jgi:hypothetical protein
VLDTEPVRTAHAVRVLWAAWCDAVIAYREGDGGGDGGEEPWPWVLEYVGTGLTAAQKECLAGDAELKRAAPLGEVVFFGSYMHDGLRGYVVRIGNDDGVAAAAADAKALADQKIVLFATDVEMQNGVPETQTFLVSETQFKGVLIPDVKIDSKGCVSFYMKANGESIIIFKDVAQFRRHLASGTSEGTGFVGLEYESSDPPQRVINAITATSIDSNGRVCTFAMDTRYPHALGRSSEGGDLDLGPLDYLEETRVTKVASGGYMSAAVSSDGELFLWGQACPGSERELDVLKEDGKVEGLVTGIGGVEEQDDFVKLLDVRIDGQEARVYDVAIGHGHVLVAAEVGKVGGETKRVVFAGGDNSKSQLGLGPDEDFKSTFEEVTFLRGKRIIQLATAGWSSYVVTLED